MRTCEPNDFALFSEKFNYDIPDISDIGKNYIGSEYLNETIIPNIYNRALEISDANELPCSINSTAQSLNCTEYTNIYGSTHNHCNIQYPPKTFPYKFDRTRTVRNYTPAAHNHHPNYNRLCLP